MQTMLDKEVQGGQQVWLSSMLIAMLCVIIFVSLMPNELD